VVETAPLSYESPGAEPRSRLKTRMYTDYDTLRTMLRIAHSPSTFNLRRAAFADTLLTLITSFGAVNRLVERIDERIYPEQKDTPLGEPIYIVAAPRSGTTFLHRLMLRDAQFTSFKLYQTFFPTITGYKVAARLKRVNGRMGAALSAFTRSVDNSSFGGWDGIHDTGLNADEEDEALWALALATPAIWLVLPFPEKFEYLRFVDRLPDEKKQKLIEYYRGCVQRHLYLNPGKTLLSKNVLLPGRFDIVTGAVPDARFVHILRHPYEALPSMLSLFTTPWRWHSPNIRLDGPEARALTELTIDYYKFLHAESQRCAKMGERRFATITYHELMADPVAKVREIYTTLGLTMSPAFAHALEQERLQQKHYKSEHVYSLEQFGLSKEYVYEQLGELFDFYGFAR
jgi:omega-hydroxy-beta-dihydromenaquinone-9 sulfotransferase